MLCCGALFKAEDTGRYMLIQRSLKSSYGEKWTTVGGKIHINEKPLDGVQREIFEEIGFNPKITKWTTVNIYNSPDKKFTYITLLFLTPSEFIPKLNSENDGYCWVRNLKSVYPLHPRFKDILSFNMLVESLNNFS